MGTDLRERAEAALTLFNERRYGEARLALEQVIVDGFTAVPCLLALAAAREYTGEYDGGIAVLEALYKAAPQEDHAVHLAAAMMRAGARDRLDHWFPALLAAHPASRPLRGLHAEHALKRGDWAAGFADLRSRWSLSGATPATAALACPEWDGAPFDGTLLVGTEQGLGDVVLWSCLFTDLAARGQRALIACDARLLPLFRRSFPTLAFADQAGDALAVAAREPGARKRELIDLAPLLRAGGAGFPVRAPWLRVDEPRRDAYRAQLRRAFPGRRLVGLSWRSGRDAGTDSKNVPPDALAPLLGAAELACFNLQYGDVSAECAHWQAQGLDINSADSLDVTQDIDGVCAFAAALDTVVSSSSTLAHLAGATGCPTRVLLSGARYLFWYWGYEGAASAFYPTATLFRGPPRRDWRDLAEDIVAELRAAPAPRS